MWLRRLDAAISDAERREAERARGAARRPPAPAWLIETGIGDGPPTYVHAGDCYAAKGARMKGITAEQARRALYEQVPACPHCRPDSRLRVVE
ncbi:DUF6233 domain-containing protein [Streptomyces sp. NPDC017940]|uniref:DUF6233 domain-containing protein n=1 Tax=Streptomyces sp. NPDC017940 TaxID=3365017 RepID=UPI0037A9AB55